MNESRQPFFSPVRLIIGLTVLAVGVLLTLDTMDVLEAREVLVFWPLALVAIGLTKAFSQRVSDMIFAAVFIIAGAWFLAYNLEWVDAWPPSYFWPILLIVVGGYLILGGMRRPAADGTEAADAYVKAFAFWSGVERVSSSEDFRGADLTAVMGAVELDLTQARIRQSPAVIQVFTLWGGVELKLPQDWKVEYALVPIIGGYGDETRQTTDDDSPTVIIKGTAIMAGLDIKN